MLPKSSPLATTAGIVTIRSTPDAAESAVKSYLRFLVKAWKNGYVALPRGPVHPWERLGKEEVRAEARREYERVLGSIAGPRPPWSKEEKPQ